MRRIRSFSITLWVLAAVLIGTQAWCFPPITASESDKCPVCGMFVAKYPDWLAQIVFDDQSTVFFDGVKDLFKYYFNLPAYNPAQKPGDISSIRVSDYYSMEAIDGRAAWYVIGSDVYGPMGRELIPFVSREDAEVFIQDHRGKEILRFEDVTPELIETLD